MNIIDGNILDYIGENNLICHQVNCRGVMGAGLALQIKRLVPEVYNQYLYACNSFHRKNELLGKIQIVNGCVNMFAQLNYGTQSPQTDYIAFESCVKKISSVAKGRDVYFPYGIGCGLAGGDWNVVSDIITNYIPDAIFVKYNK